MPFSEFRASSEGRKLAVTLGAEIIAVRKYVG